MSDDVRTEAARIASALKAMLTSGEDILPDLPTPRAAVTRTAAPRPAQSQRQAHPLNRTNPAPRTDNDSQPPSPAIAAESAGEFLSSLPDDLGRLRECVASCTRCRLAAGRSTTVFGEGPLNPVLMIVGEAPGPVEDASGRPFSGDAGALLTKIVNAMGLDREKQCYLTTILKCRMTDDSTPTPDVVGLCRPFLTKQIQTCKPRFLLAMGQTAATVLAGSPSITRLRGRLLMHDDIPMLVTYHPAALLRDPALKKAVWEDVQLIMARLKG